MHEKVMLFLGTYLEAIKMCPLVNKYINTVVCVMGQLRQTLDMVLEAFLVISDYDFSINRIDTLRMTVSR